LIVCAPRSTPLRVPASAASQATYHLRLLSIFEPSKAPIVSLTLGILHIKCAKGYLVQNFVCAQVDPKCICLNPREALAWNARINWPDWAWDVFDVCDNYIYWPLNFPADSAASLGLISYFASHNHWWKKRFDNSPNYFLWGHPWRNIILFCRSFLMRSEVA
jgi:hypothetical protein